MNGGVMTDKELERIGNYVQDHLPEWMDGERSPRSGPREGDLIEKMLHQMDMRFEQRIGVSTI